MEFEKYTPVGVNKDDRFTAIQRDRSRIYLPGFCYDIANTRLYSNEEGNRGSALSLPGFEEIQLPSFINRRPLKEEVDTCIGIIPYDSKGLLILFIYNSANAHRILSYNVKTGTWNTLVQGSMLNFSTGHRITDTRYGFNQNYVIFTDFYNPIRQIDITKTLIDPYEQQISYHKACPRNRVEFQKNASGFRPTRVYDSAITVNSIAYDNFRFAARFLYPDGTYSVFSQPSWTSLADDDPTADGIENKILIELQLTEEEFASIQSVEFAYVKNNDFEYSVFRTVEKNVATQEKLIQTEFLGKVGGELVDTELSIKPFEEIPELSRNFQVAENKAFMSFDKLGYNLKDFQIQITQKTLNDNNFIAQSGLPKNNIDDLLVEGTFKEKGLYEVGVICYDAKLRYSTVLKSREFEISAVGPASEPIIQITGNVPKKWKYYSVVTSINRQQGNYMHVPVVPMYYIGDVENYTSAPSNVVNYYERYYITNLDLTNVVEVHYVLPKNIAFAPVKGMRLRVRKGNNSNYVTMTVLDYHEDANVVVVNYDSNKIATPLATGTQQQIDVEIFDPVEQISQTFYESSRLYPIIDGKISERLIYLKGDTFKITPKSGNPSASDAQWFFPQYYNNTVWPYTVYDQAVSMGTYEVPTPTFGNSYDNDIEFTQIDLIEVQKTVDRGPRITGGDSFEFNKIEKITRVFRTAVTRIAGPDYNRVTDHRGRPTLKTTSIQEKNDLPLLVYSNAANPDVSFNGLSVVDQNSAYMLEEFNGPVIALIRVNNILLSIHAHKSSSLYVGEGILRAGEDTILTQTDNVIGDEYRHTRTHGTIHPESVKEHDGNVFWWDHTEGVVVQYTRGGLVPISYRKMYSYFKQLARKYDPYLSEISIIGSIDPRNSEYLLSFPAVGNLPGETWAYNFDEQVWTSRYEYIPEATAHIQDRLFSFKNGKLWSHQGRIDGKRNYFYGEQKYSKLTFVVNPAPDQNKKFQNIHIESTKISDSGNPVIVRITNDRGQETYMKYSDFKKVNEKYISPILRDINSRVDSGKLALRDGNDIDSQYILVEVTMQTTGEFILNNIAVAFNMSGYTR